MDKMTLDWLKKNDYSLENIDYQGKYGNTALMKASREGNATHVDKLLEAGADITLKNIDGNTALWLSCVGENPDIVNMLIKKGIEIDTLNVNGVTSLCMFPQAEKNLWLRF